MTFELLSSLVILPYLSFFKFFSLELHCKEKILITHPVSFRESTSWSDWLSSDWLQHVLHQFISFDVLNTVGLNHISNNNSLFGSKISGPQHVFNPYQVLGRIVLKRNMIKIAGLKGVTPKEFDWIRQWYDLRTGLNIKLLKVIS